jgi:hypothetical protein
MGHRKTEILKFWKPRNLETHAGQIFSFSGFHPTHCPVHPPSDPPEAALKTLARSERDSDNQCRGITISHSSSTTWRFTMTTQTHLTRKTVPENHRLAITAKIFGGHFPTILEPLIYNFTDKMADDYHGGYWEFYTLSNGGFYMAPDSDSLFHITCDNLFEGNLSAVALGITVCLYAYSHLSFAGVPDLADTCNNQYHLLRDCVFEHRVLMAIVGATD